MESSVKVPKSFNNYKSEIFWGMGLFQIVNLVLFFGLILISVYLSFIGLYSIVIICLTVSVLLVSLVLEYQGISYFAIIRRKFNAYSRNKKYYMENRSNSRVLSTNNVTKNDYRIIISVVLAVLIFILILIGVYSFAFYVFFS